LNKRLTDKQLTAIKVGYIRDGLSMADLAAIYRVSRMHVWRIVQGVSPKFKTTRSFISKLKD